MKRVLAISSLCGILLLAGCDSHLSNEPDIPLSGEELSLLRSLTGSLDRAANAVEKARSEQEEGAKRSIPSDSASHDLEGSVSEKEDPFVSKMATKIGRQFCRIDASLPGGEATSLKNEFLVVEGTVCPIAFSSRVEAKVQRLQENINLEYNYQVLDSGYRQLNDVDQVSLLGLVSSLEDRGGKRSNVFFKGSIRSQKKGVFFLRMESNVESLSQGGAKTLVISIHSKDLHVKAVMEVIVGFHGEKPVVRYSINGKTFEEKEFKSLIGRQLSVEWSKYFLSKLMLS